MSTSVYIITPLTGIARTWVKENVPLESWQMYGNSFAVENRYHEDIINGMHESGLDEGKDYETF